MADTENTSTDADETTTEEPGTEATTTDVVAPGSTEVP